MTSFERGEGGEKPDIQAEKLRAIDLGTLETWAQQFDQVHGERARIFRRVLRERGPDGEEIREEPGERDARVRAEEEKASAAAREIALRTASLTEPVGLAVSFEENSDGLPTEWRVVLTDSAKFLAYLKALHGHALQGTQARGISFLGERMEEAIIDRGLSGRLDDSDIELLSSLPQIAEAYAQLGQKYSAIDRSAQQLRMLGEASQGGYLREWLPVHMLRLHKTLESKEWGPARLHEDSSPESYIEGWKRYLSVLEEIERNPKAHALAERVRANLLTILRFIQDEIKHGKIKHLAENEVNLFLEHAIERLARKKEGGAR